MSPNPAVTVHVDENNTATVSSDPAINPAKTSLAVNNTTGAFSGKFTLDDSLGKRTVSYLGVIVMDQGTHRGYGFFMNPQPPSKQRLSGPVSLYKVP